jgi:hypothetical protein
MRRAMNGDEAGLVDAAELLGSEQHPGVTGMDGESQHLAAELGDDGTGTGRKARPGCRRMDRGE